MTRTTNSIFLFDDVWAADGDTTSAPFDPRTGWDSTYSQAGGNTVSRTLVNGEFNKFSALCYDVNRYGSNLFWDATITYEIGATVLGSDNQRYIAATQNSNNNPTLDDGTNWTPLKITFASDSNISIVEDAATNTVTFSLTGSISNKANSDLSNVPIGDFAAKIADGQYTYKQIVGSQVQINSYAILTDANVTFSSDTLNKQMTFGTSENLAKLKDNYTGSSAPSPTVAGQLWNNTSYKTLYIRNNSNSDWITIANADSYSNVISTGTKNINNIDNSRFYILDTSGTTNPITLQLPLSSSVDEDFRMDFVSYGNSDITILPFSGEQFYRDGALTSSLILSNQQNAVFSIIKNSTTNIFYVIGSTKGVDQDLDGLSDAGYKKILDFMCPVGSKWSTYDNNTPPLNGVLGVTWSLISPGYACVTASTTFGGVFSGTKTLNSSLAGTYAVEGHQITLGEMPAHNHIAPTRYVTSIGDFILYGLAGNSGSNALTTTGIPGQAAFTSTTGSGSPHTHNLDIKTISEVCYKRVS